LDKAIIKKNKTLLFYKIGTQFANIVVYFETQKYSIIDWLVKPLSSEGGFLHLMLGGTLSKSFLIFIKKEKIATNN